MFGNNFILSSVLYTSYNSLLLVPILINLKKYKLDKTKIIILSSLITCFIGILMILIYNKNRLFLPEILNVEMPNMLFATMISSKMKIAYGIVILSAIFTTAFSSGFNFLEMSDKQKYEKNALIICIIAFIFSRVGFSRLINIFFPFFGYLGLFQILLILKCLKNREVKK